MQTMRMILACAVTSFVALPVLAEISLPIDHKQTLTTHDFSWLNGSNHQPSSLLSFGPITFSAYVDAYYGFQFWQPNDHTIFPTTTAIRHNEISINLAALGIELGGTSTVLNTRFGGPIGRLYLQYGGTVDAVAGQDQSTRRGFFLSQRAFMPIQQAAAGWHFPFLQGINLELGIFPSVVGLESYLTEENWNYTHSFMSDFTPFYFTGARAQLLLTPALKLELLLVNAWQTFGKWQETFAGGYLFQWRIGDWMAIGHSVYLGREQPNDLDSLRAYSDNHIQARYFTSQGLMKSLTASLVADIGYEHRTQQSSGIMGGLSFAHRVEFPGSVFFSLRGDAFYDQSHALIAQLPSGSVLPGAQGDVVAPWLGGGITATVDYWPSPWLVLRLEYVHRWVNQPYFSGPGGISMPEGVSDLRSQDDRLMFNMTLRL